MNEIGENEARVAVTYSGQFGYLPDPVPRDSADGDVRQWVTEAVRAGSIREIGAQPNADFTDFVVDRHAKPESVGADGRDYALIAIRPKTPFGS